MFLTQKMNQEYLSIQNLNNFIVTSTQKNLCSTRLDTILHMLVQFMLKFN